MGIDTITQKSGLKKEVAESLYWHSIWLRNAAEDAEVNWLSMLKDKHYRLFGEIKSEEKRV